MGCALDPTGLGVHSVFACQHQHLQDLGGRRGVKLVVEEEGNFGGLDGCKPLKPRQQN